VDSKFQGKKVTFVDVFSKLTLSDLPDGIHPNEVGARLLKHGKAPSSPFLA